MKQNNVHNNKTQIVNNTFVNGMNLDVLKETVSQISQDSNFGKCYFRASNKWLGGTDNINYK